jgi:hypothetical protein
MLVDWSTADVFEAKASTIVELSIMVDEKKSKE